MTACEERYFGGEQNVSTNKSTFTTIYNHDTLAENRQCKCPLCCILLFLFQQDCLISQVPFHGTLSRHGKTRASSVLRMTYRKRCYTLYLLFWLFSLYQQEDPARRFSTKTQQRRAAFPEKAAAKAVSGCYMLYLLFKLFSLYQQEDAARRLNKKPQHKVLTKQLTPD